MIVLIKSIYPFTIYSLVIYTSIRITYLIKYKIKFDIFKEIIFVLFIMYLIILFYLISKPIYIFNIINLKPFKEILRYNINSKLFIKNIIGNILLFIPFSLFLTFYLKINRLYIIILLGFILSLTIEIIQIGIGRVFDIDDIILNVFSSIIGYYIYKLYYHYS